MSEYLERKAAVMRLMQDGCTAKNVQSIMELPAVDVEKSQMDTTLSQTCMNRGSFCLLLLPKIIRMHGKASGMRTAAFLSVGDGSSWALTQKMDATHTTMS